MRTRTQAHQALLVAINYLNLNGPSDLKNRYVSGNPDEISDLGRSSLPLCFIYTDETEISNYGLQENNHEKRIMIIVMVDSSIDKGSDPRKRAARNTLEDIVEGWDPATNRLREDTIAYVLGRRQQLGTNLWLGLRESSRIVYGSTKSIRGNGLDTNEAKISAVITGNQLKPGV